MKRTRPLALLLLLTLCLTGCWDRVEVNDVAIVSMVGIDKVPKGLRLTINVLVPPKAAAQGGAGGDKAAVTYSAEGESVMDAMSKLQERVSRRIFWAHMRILVMGEEFARSGVRQALDFWSRHREPRLLIKIAVTPGKAADLLEAKPRLEKLLTEAIRESINQRHQADITLKEFVRRLRAPTEQPVAPRVMLVPGKDGKDALISGSAVFHEDRMIGWLTDGETRGLLWLRGEVQTGTVTLGLPSGGRASLILIRGSTRIHPQFQNGRLRIQAAFLAEDDVYETSAPIDLGKDEVIQVIQELLRKEVEQRIRETLTKIQQEFRVDIVGFGDAVYRAAPRRWEAGLKKQWPELFPKVPVEIKVTAYVRRSGEHAAPLSVKEEQIKSKQSELLQPKE